MVFSEEVQTMMQVLLQAAKVITSMIKTFVPAINQLQRHFSNINDLNLMDNRDFTEVRRVLLWLTVRLP